MKHITLFLSMTILMNLVVGALFNIAWGYESDIRDWVHWLILALCAVNSYHLSKKILK